MKYFFLILITFFQIQLFGQVDINVPHYKYVQIDYHLRDYISVSVDNNGGLYVENDSIAFSDLRKNLFERIKYKSKYKDLRLSIMIIELIVDKNLAYEKLEKILYQFPQLGFLKIHFVCNSNDKIRFEQVCTTGFLFGLNYLDNNDSVINEVMDSLKNEMDDDFIKLNQGYFNHNNKLIPPPPPPPNITASQLKNQNSKRSVKNIKILPLGFKIGNTNYSKKELASKIKEWCKTETTSFVLSPTKNCTYEDLLFPLAELKSSLMELWEEESKNRFNQEYANLNYKQRREVRNKYPFILVFEEPNKI